MNRALISCLDAAPGQVLLARLAPAGQAVWAIPPLSTQIPSWILLILSPPSPPSMCPSCSTSTQGRHSKLWSIETYSRWKSGPFALIRLVWPLPASTHPKEETENRFIPVNNDQPPVKRHGRTKCHSRNVSSHGKGGTCTTQIWVIQNGPGHRAAGCSMRINK